MKNIFLAIAAFFSFSVAASADTVSDSVVGLQGYDLVSYHQGEKPLQGNGNHLVTHGGVNYLFTSKANKNAFKKNPAKYLPAYGGFCAYGAAVGKKFIGDPTVWKLVDGKLYLNLDNNVKSIWIKNIPENIEKADENWAEIKNIPAADL
ncbi:MAG: YHS domain protein [Kordiimonadales bacterium]|nr:MAG: YHS domain protein [Kordiimonadales bacterium]